MNRRLILCAILICSLRSVAAGSEIGDLKWDQSNISRLRSYGKTEVLRFVNPWSGNTANPIKSRDLLDFGWFDLAGDGKYELVTTSSFGPCCVFVNVYTQDAMRKVSQQSLREAMRTGKLSDTVRDLNGDGKAELVVWKEVAEPHTWIPMAATPQWPAIYRLEKGKYVEASRDFPAYYDNEVLPELDKEIGKEPNENASAIAALEKDKILRVLGRDPVAGLNQAYQWMNSDDPQVLQCAIATFADIGGHDKELHAAQQALPAAEKREMESRKGG